MTNFWKILPSATPDDSRWLTYEIYDEVIVAAETPSMARQIARELDRHLAEPGAGNESRPFRSAFDDAKLYRVQPFPSEAAVELELETSVDPRILRAERRGARALP